MRADLLREIIVGTDTLDVPTDARELFKRLVRNIGARHGVRGIAHAERVDCTRRLLDLHTPRSAIRDWLIEQFGISRSAAYLVIHDALNCLKQRRILDGGRE